MTAIFESFLEKWDRNPFPKRDYTSNRSVFMEGIDHSSSLITGLEIRSSPPIKNIENQKIPPKE